MNSTNITRSNAGVITVSGELVFDKVVALLKISNQYFDGSSTLLFNLHGVVKTDSAGLALLVEWTRLAFQKGQAINFCDVPKQLLDIARVSGLDDLLPIV
ncbi:MAG: anti-sigma-factor [Piscirickettsiaceae bacterium]|nr:MAG: anti-sigma-factor [Piscirickettsiaceae bacterium]